MHSRTLSGLLVLILLAVSSAYSAISLHRGDNLHQLVESAASQADPISGGWSASFFVNGNAHPSTFDLKLDGTKVTGSANSDHTGPGTVRDGTWSEGKLSFTLDFKKHESIALKGTLKDGKLAGEFTTEGFTSNWEATRK